MRPARRRMLSSLFFLGDHIAGALTGAATAGAIHSVVTPGMDMALAMVVGMAVGMAVHLPIGLLLAPFLGAFHVMTPGSIIGMWGGMLFGMRTAMQAHSSPAHALMAGAAFGVLVTGAVQLYDKVLRGTAKAADRP